ncbi:hypothetical protein J8I26_04420 [Herbaspirillum sp. LeCh32-8]|uniref:hypothetical protein n=1 Tax=Herbaspirillum sp. LeCh32-8 TaxID=2821356 RepID=UPI001AE2A9BE|nr:hypothetical protein [Herbaspirillum sp. LeCh32-8]MBP0597336.1 hypothetical protein [Herbaspirillum sp. LeCh32-8]
MNHRADNDGWGRCRGRFRENGAGPDGTAEQPAATERHCGAALRCVLPGETSVPFPAIAFNPATAAAVTKAFAPLTKSVAASFSKFTSVLRNCTPEKMAQAFSANPRLAGAMEKLRPHIQQALTSLKNSDTFQRLMQAVREYAGDSLQDKLHNAATAGADKQGKDHDLHTRKQLLPPGAHSLSPESLHGNVSIVSATVGQERWHVMMIAEKNIAVTRTDWQPGPNGIKSCKTWDSATQRNWQWIKNKAGDMIAMGELRPARDGGHTRTVFHCPADGGPISHMLMHIDTDGRASLRDPAAMAGKRGGELSPQTQLGAHAAQRQSGFIQGEVDEDDAPAAKPGAGDSQALVRRTAQA